MKISVVMSGIILLTFVLSGCGEKIKPGEQEIKRPMVQGVSIEEAALSEVDNYYEATGTVRSRNTSLVAAKIMGEVKDIKVLPGAVVKKGQNLLVISAPDVNARAQAAQEGIEEAKKAVDMAREKMTLSEKTFERYRKLYEERAVTGQEFDEIRSRREVAVLEYERLQKALKRAEAGLEEATAFRGYSVIQSPVSGIVAEKKIEIGSMAAPGTPLFVIEESLYRIEVPVDEGLLTSIRTGDPVSVSIDAIQMSTKGKVGEIVRQVDPLTRAFTVKIDIDENPKLLRGGFYAKAKFLLGKKSGLFIPEQAVISRGDLKGVYTVSQEGVVTFRLVKVGKKADGRVEIISGLNAGEKVVVKGAEEAVDGGKIAE